ncbi:ferredoxin [Leptospira ryugenii]|uniref:Ferredoxin n=1 Tax=Leptospira ryugenii TaxID=1917863 RepID=A0A2P2DW21_9LEPT|nr:ferredoxin family protein [Leptospira ryugenii]GBF48823.1 ferredoxin [Leptospira ryugenii]
MAHIITSKCKENRYTDCVEVCPVDAFHLLENMLVINPETCIDCSACVAECPVSAIYSDQLIPEEEKPFIEFNERESKTSPVIAKKIPPLAK